MGVFTHTGRNPPTEAEYRPPALLPGKKRKVNFSKKKEKGSLV